MAYIFQTTRSFSQRRLRALFRKPQAWLVTLTAAWFIILAFFFFNPQFDILVARAFFQQAACAADSPTAKICGLFPYAGDSELILLRKILFYSPGFIAILILIGLVKNLQHHGATYDAEKTRRYSIALISFALGPYVLVNLILKTISGRPRPYETDLFGGVSPFTAAGTLDGSCLKNCSFISGEAAGAGWIACLIVLLPMRWRLIVAPPIIGFCLLSPTLRVAFGGHYISDVLLGFLSSCVVYAAVACYFQMTQSVKKRVSKTAL
ncbi:phosphatase PAP2 family protein [Rhizobium sp. SSA_523]|uniref:phosphatase PAP2 family protein n=1 Tax=Rhizobium sp. SSA_523 TaxID=2952477 RepID=UPI002091E03E|nr:phosphatase PAP2 family protein [Rhizobium sp. SSA_523]MCO5730758.1 phosphatase PAP2 family protein [Rhizobium sp. SSA_523]WKC24418.1 phosphatase PAP2 family protein [Rhizobium sp. SSA_523]